MTKSASSRFETSQSSNSTQIAPVAYKYPELIYKGCSHSCISCAWASCITLCSYLKMTAGLEECARAFEACLEIPGIIGAIDSTQVFVSLFPCAISRAILIASPFQMLFRQQSALHVAPYCAEALAWVTAKFRSECPQYFLFLPGLFPYRSLIWHLL